MQKDGLELLRKQLREEPPAVMAELSEEDLAHLATAVRHARHHQAEQIQTASDQALEHIPRLLRGPVKKIIG